MSKRVSITEIRVEIGGRSARCASRDRGRRSTSARSPRRRPWWRSAPWWRQWSTTRSTSACVTWFIMLIARRTTDPRRHAVAAQIVHGRDAGSWSAHSTMSGGRQTEEREERGGEKHVDHGARIVCTWSLLLRFRNSSYLPPPPTSSSPVTRLSRGGDATRGTRRHNGPRISERDPRRHATPRLSHILPI